MPPCLSVEIEPPATHAYSPIATPVEVRELTDAQKPACESILRALPEWFGIEEAIAGYARAIERLPTFGAFDAGELVGFVALEEHFEHAAEVHVMAVPRAHHRRGIGRALLAHAEAWLRARGVRWLQVKTLGPSREDEPYARTRPSTSTRASSRWRSSRPSGGRTTPVS